ncbi:dihydrodipicolinate reductase [Jannaschia sp. 2305UL9-9]|uniref:dihydrodipicolinate reductase n=1 Tax=Jannaschia sp. 2305UL9-9 TaxID=3121638 RepID=UPI0035299905
MKYAIIALAVFAAHPATAFEAVTTRDAFVALVEGRTLRGDGVSLRVGPDGSIAGRGFGLRVTGAWDWQDGLFCRTLDTAIRDFPRNCQTVAVQNGTLRFTADRGTGDVADLSLR